jgi:hypothetical protein
MRTCSPRHRRSCTLSPSVSIRKRVPQLGQLTLRTAGTLQGVPPSCCGRRAAVASGVCSNRPRVGKRHDAQAACEPGGGGCGARHTSDELTVLYSNGPDDRSVKLALGYVTAATSGCTPHCKAHGGGKRCQHEGCTKSSRGDTEHCVLHGGGRRCQKKGCPKAAATGGTPHCTVHGGGRRCQHEGYFKSVAKAVCTARYVSNASSPTMRRTMHRKSVARPRRPNPRVGSRSW